MVAALTLTIRRATDCASTEASIERSTIDYDTAGGETSEQGGRRLGPIRRYVNNDFIPGLEHRLAPALVGHARCTCRFYNPMRRVTTVVLRIDLQEAVGIGPKPLRDRSLHRDHFRGVVHRGPVVCEQRNGNRQQTNRYQGNDLSFLTATLLRKCSF